MYIHAGEWYYVYMMMNMLNDPSNNPRLAIQQRELDKLQNWYERELDQIEEDFRQDRITLAQYQRLTREAEEVYQEDYADIFAG